MREPVLAASDLLNTLDALSKLARTLPQAGSPAAADARGAGSGAPSVLPSVSDLFTCTSQIISEGERIEVGHSVTAALCRCVANHPCQAYDPCSLLISRGNGQTDTAARMLAMKEAQGLSASLWVTAFKI